MAQTNSQVRAQESLIKKMELQRQKVFAKETDSNVVFRNLSVISTETLVCFLCTYFCLQ